MQTNKVMINGDLLDNKKIEALRQSFNQSTPFKFLIVDNFLQPEFAEKIESSFPSINSMKVKYKGINENKAEDSSFEKFDCIIQELNIFIHSPLIT
ncbi:MAG: hypothetical protein ABIN74_04885, partial [Ferruginibacter sp.]